MNFLHILNVLKSSTILKNKTRIHNNGAFFQLYGHNFYKIRKNIYKKKTNKKKIHLKVYTYEHTNKYTYVNTNRRIFVCQP